MATHQLIGAEVSLYTGKLRSYLNYKRIPFEEVVACKEVYRDIILPRTGVSYIPILITDDDVALQDTTEIIDYLETRYPDNAIYPEGPCQRLAALMLETYADEWLVIPAMHYRWSIEENREFAIREFGRTSAPQACAEDQLAIGRENAKPFAGALPRLGVSDSNQSAIETSYLSLLDDLNHHFAAHDFLLGSRPSIGDFGLIGPLYAHLYRDPYSGRLMKARAPQVAAWVERMIDPSFSAGEFLPEDRVPTTLLPVLARMVSEQGPVLQSTQDQLMAWAATAEDGQIPRVIGEVSFQIEGITGKRLTFPYMLWMWQRPYDAYHALQTEDQERVDALLQTIPGAQELLGYPLTQRVKRVNNRLQLDS